MLMLKLTQEVSFFQGLANALERGVVNGKKGSENISV